MPDQTTELLPMPTQAIAKRQTIDADELIAKAIDSRAPVESLERLLAMRKEILADQAREDYFAALARFQSECPVVGKTRSVKLSGGGYRFAPMEDIKPKVDPFIRKHGFSYRWDVRGEIVYCIITHAAGHSEESSFPLRSAKAPAMNEVQGLASGMSYAKRYSFVNGFGIVVGDEDDDGQSAELKLITEEQAITINDCLESSGADRDSFYRWASEASKREVMDPLDIPAGQFDKVMAMLKRKLAQKGKP